MAALPLESQQRYARQLLLPEVGEAGQAKLAAASVLIIGAGGLGSPAAFFLAGAGVGRIGLADSDRVDLSNLHRQILHATPDVGRLKTDSGREALAGLNPGVVIEPHALRITAANIGPLAAAYDFVISAVDNFAGKFLISDACVRGGKPFCHAGVLGWEGQIFTYLPGGRSGCCRCLLPAGTEAPEAAAPVPVLGSIPGVLGALQATEALKWILGIPGLLVNRLLHIDGKRMRFREVAFQPSRDCPICGKDR